MIVIAVNADLVLLVHSPVQMWTTNESPKPMMSIRDMIVLCVEVDVIRLISCSTGRLPSFSLELFKGAFRLFCN